MKHTLARTALGAAALDLALKMIPLGADRTLIPGVLGLTRTENRGVAFGLLSGSPLFNLAVTSLLIAGLGFWLSRQTLTRFEALAAGLMLGGALGNLMDRLLHGMVSDYLQLLFIQFPVFNLADICLTAGAALLMLQLLFLKKEAL